MAETPEQAQEFTAQADGLAARHGRHEAIEHRRVWEQLQAAVSGWEQRPETTRAAYSGIAQAKAAGEIGVDAVTWRNLRQAAEVTGHIETRISGSAQDGARWRPPQRSAGADAERTDLLDRALGGRGPELTNLAEIDAIIAETDQLLAAEEELSDLDTGADARTARQRSALRQLQDRTAEHARLADRWDGSPEQDQAHIAHLESLLEAARSARVTAADAGVRPAHIEAVYRAGRDGTYWHEQSSTSNDPGAPPLSGPIGGADIGEAIDAALPEAEPGEWSPINDFETNTEVAPREVDAEVSL